MNAKAGSNIIHFFSVIPSILLKLRMDPDCKANFIPSALVDISLSDRSCRGSFPKLHNSWWQLTVPPRRSCVANSVLSRVLGEDMEGSFKIEN